MRTLSTNTFLTLDGIYQAPGAPQEDPTGGFTHGGWTVKYWDDVMEKTEQEGMGKPFDLLLGRRTYEIFAAYWPFQADEAVAGPLNTATKWVASKTLDKVDWQNSHLLKGHVVQEVRRLKEKAGPDIQIHGSGNLIQTLMKHGLIDVYHLWIFPLVLGKGKRLFADDADAAGLKLVDCKTSSTGVLIATYQPAGKPELGSFVSDDPSELELERRQKLAAEERREGQGVH